MTLRGAMSAAAAVMLLPTFGETPAGVVHLDLPASAGVTKAALDYLPPPGARPRGILVLVPGFNGSGAQMLAEERWTGYARENGFGLAALTLASDEEELEDGRGYYDASAGSGAAVDAALKKINAGRAPVFMYGFSGGAYFTSAFAEYFPQALKGWCAASFGKRLRGAGGRVAGDKGNRPPGIVACGEDDSRLGEALAYYWRGRGAGRKWTWIEVAGLAHERCEPLEAFARRYFLCLMNKKATGVWRDFGSGEDVAHSAASAKALQTWLPSADLVEDWRALSTKKNDGIIEHIVKTKLKDYEKITLFLRLPKGDARPKGVLCLSVLANTPLNVREMLRTKNLAGHGIEDSLCEFAEKRGFAVVAWGARRLWNPMRNWDELPRAEAKRIDSSFDHVASAWDTAMDFFADKYGVPRSGYVMYGGCGAAQYAMRLALRRPSRFLAVHVHMPGSYDVPVKDGSSILWCITIGENEIGCERSRRFFRRARDIGYSIVYKTYPGLGHAWNVSCGVLGLACFRYALAEQARVAETTGDRLARPDWSVVFAAAPYVADIFNQHVYPREDDICIPPEFRMRLPEELKEVWLRE